METFSALLALCAGNSPVSGEFPTQRPVTRSFDVFFDLCLNKRLSKQWWGWWFETLSCPLWRHRNGPVSAPGPRFNIKMTSYQSRKSHCGDETILRPSYLYNGISYTCKMTSLNWIRALNVFNFQLPMCMQVAHFPRYWPFVRGIHRSPVNSPHKGQWRGALMFSLICAWINAWVSNREAGDLIRYGAHYDVTVIKFYLYHFGGTHLYRLVSTWVGMVN